MAVGTTASRLGPSPAYSARAGSRRTMRDASMRSMTYVNASSLLLEERQADSSSRRPPRNSAQQSPALRLPSGSRRMLDLAAFAGAGRFEGT